jgi:hypothetical protein
MDEGGAIQGLRLDIFAGEGPDLNSSLYGTSDAAIWIYRTQFLGRTTTSDGRQANGPAAVYEIIPEAYKELYHSLFCKQFLPYPHPIRDPTSHARISPQELLDFPHGPVSGELCA